MFSDYNPKLNKASQQWETDLALDLSTEEWERVYTHTQRDDKHLNTTRNLRYSPDVINTWQTTQNLPWSFSHMLEVQFRNGLIDPFMVELPTYTNILDRDHHITHHNLVTWMFTRTILHHTSIPQSAFRRSLTLHLINTSKMCIPGEKRTSLLKKNGSNFFAEMEDLVLQAKETPDKF